MSHPIQLLVGFHHGHNNHMVYQIYHNLLPFARPSRPLPKSLHTAKNQAIRPVHFRSCWVLRGVPPWALPAPTLPPRQPHAGSGGVGSQRWTGWQQHCWRKLREEATAVANSFGRAAPLCHAQAVGSPPTWPWGCRKWKTLLQLGGDSEAEDIFK